MINRTASCGVRVLRLAAALAAISFAGTPAAAGTFTDTNFTGDADSGIVGHGVYTHALKLDFDDNRTVNGAVFTGTGTGVAAPSTNNYSIAGPTNTFGGNTNNLSGNSNGLATSFVYNGQPEVVTLRNLRIGQSYVTTFYGVGFGSAGGRVSDITASDGGSVVYDQNKAGDKNGNRLEYAFTATANTQSFTITPRVPADTFHTYALTNRLLGYNALLTDNFYLGTSNGDPGGPTFLNTNLPARQGGTLAAGGATPITYTAGGNVQVGNGPTGPVDRGNYLLTAFGGSASPDYNFNGSDPRMRADRPILISFDMAPNLGNADPGNWGAIDVGLAPDRRNVFVNDAAPHFGILFRSNGLIQAFDGATDITALGTGGANARWYADDGVNRVTNALHHFELILSDATASTIEVYADGNLVSTFNKPGGFANSGNNYINFVGSDIAGFDNLIVAQVPEPTALGLVSLAALTLATRRHRRSGPR